MEKILFDNPFIGYAYHRIILDESGKPYDYEFLDINPAFEKLTGLKREDVLHNTVRKIIPGIENSEFDWISFYGEIALNGGKKEFEQFSEKLNRWYKVFVYSPQPMTFSTLFIDITKDKENEENLRKSNERLHLLLEGLSHAVWLVNRDRKILYQNKMAENLFHTKVGEYCWNTIHKGQTLPEQYRQPYEERGEVLSGAKCWFCRGDEALDEKKVVNDLVELNGRFWDVWWVYIDEDIYMHYAIDITERIKMKDELIKSERLISIGELAGGIAHEFNNLLQGILGNIDLAMINANEAKTKEYLINARKIIEKAKILSNKLLTFSKGGFPLKKVMPLSPWIIDTIKFHASGSKLELSFHIPEELWLVNIDKEQMARVFENLIINSMQAMPLGGSISVDAINVSLDKNNPYKLEAGKYVKIIFKDNGPGIPKENLNKIFDLFFTTKEFGSGLGLSICYSIIKKHGGAIDVESDIGKGATFFIYLPALEDKNKL